MKRSISDYDNGINKVFGEFERLQGIITNLKNERNVHINKNNSLIRELEIAVFKNQTLEKQIGQISRENRSEEVVAIKRYAERTIQGLHHKLAEKDQEIEKLRYMLPRNPYKV